MQFPSPLMVALLHLQIRRMRPGYCAAVFYYAAEAARAGLVASECLLKLLEKKSLEESLEKFLEFFLEETEKKFRVNNRVRISGAFELMHHD